MLEVSSSSQIEDRTVGGENRRKRKARLEGSFTGMTKLQGPKGGENWRVRKSGVEGSGCEIREVAGGGFVKKAERRLLHWESFIKNLIPRSRQKLDGTGQTEGRNARRGQPNAEVRVSPREEGSQRELGHKCITFLVKRQKGGEKRVDRGGEMVDSDSKGTAPLGVLNRAKDGTKKRVFEGSRTRHRIGRDGAVVASVQR